MCDNSIHLHFLCIESCSIQCPQLLTVISFNLAISAYISPTIISRVYCCATCGKSLTSQPAPNSISCTSLVQFCNAQVSYFGVLLFLTSNITINCTILGLRSYRLGFFPNCHTTVLHCMHNKKGDYAFISCTFPWNFSFFLSFF